VGSEGGDLDHRSTFKKNLNQSKSPADGPAVFEEGLDLLRMSIRGDIEVFGDLSEEKITNTSANKVGYKPMSVKAVENLEGLFVDHLS
jgi:hypothetical protein